MSDDIGVKTEFYFENAQKAKAIMKEVAEKSGFRYQEMNSIAVAYKHREEAIVKYDEKLEVYDQEAEKKVESIKEEN